ncbi:F-box/kelch-repeat protein [Trifolium medium]|uniref:F-box/kelch-repeat protein n=1 Tax=Trifolium medium TaxID=97028 RepID=A0A392N1F3_9FABA|nr:F-box/kelch-repeat protein [Trifolium medium]
MPDEAENYVDFNVDYYVHGFGYDQVINDYKVIRYVYIHCELLSEYPYDDEEDVDDEEDDEERTLLHNWLISTDIDPFWEIYSLRSNSWRKLHVDMRYSLECVDGTQVYMDGVCHWYCEGYKTIDDKTVEPSLVSFYLNSEEFFVTPIPSYVDDCFYVKAWWINVAVLNGSIALISYHKETTIFHISILGEFCTKESWTKLLIVGPLSCVERPIGVGMKGEIFFIKKDGELVWLDLSTQMIAELGYKGEAVHSSEIIIYK